MSALPENWRDEFCAALAFLTRLPIGGAPAEVEAEAAVPPLAAASWAFPVVGVVIGIIGGIVYVIAAGLRIPALAAGLIAVAATVLATGGLHEDGLADTADGFGGGATTGEKLEIMRDSRTGAYGVLALIFSVGLRAIAIADIATRWHVLGALIAAHALGRGVLPGALRLLAPARSEGLGATAGQPEWGLFLIALAIAFVIALLGSGIRAGLSATIAAVLVAAAFGYLAQRQIGGQTGDVLGAIEQGAETAALLAIAAWS